MKRIHAAVLALLWSVSVLAAEAAPPKFTTKPSATKAADGQVRIEFAVDRETDVAVFIEDGNGKVVRHLVAGLLGKNPPPPLKPGLAQSIEWDGKADYGKPAPAGPCKVRVALGLGAKYDKVILSEPQNIGGPQALAAGKDGTLYVVTQSGATYAWGGQSLMALDRDGNYQRTVIPPPSNTTKEQLAALGTTPVEVGGRVVPMVQNFPNHQLTAFHGAVAGGMAADPGGRVLVLNGGARIGLIDLAEGGKATPFDGPYLFGKPLHMAHGQRVHLAASADGKFAYLSGLGHCSQGGSAAPLDNPYPAVFRVKLPERTPAEVLFGDMKATGSDETRLGGLPAGLAVDGKGHILVCDPANKRVVAISEADGKFAGSFPVEGAQLVAADGQTGAVYVLRVLARSNAELVKFDGWKDAKPLAKVPVAAARDETYWSMALDASAKPPAVWLIDSRRGLLRIEDLGGKFSDVKQVNTGTLGNLGFVGLVVDHWRDDPEVYVRSGQGGYWFTRFNEKTGAADHLKNMGFFSDAAGPNIEVGPDGNLYTQAWPMFLHKWDRTGKPLKWDAPYVVPEGIKPYVEPGKVGNAIYMPVCMVFMTHTLGFRHDGHFFAFEKKTTGPSRARKALYEYELSGKRVSGPIIWEVSDAVAGPRFDQQGNIYLADGPRPPDQLVPPEFAAVTGPVTAKSRWGQGEPNAIPAYYGTIMKFSPKGGAITYGPHYALGPQGKPYDGEPKLDPSLKTVDAACFAAGSSEFTYVGAKVTGAEWMHFGISHLFLGGCNCENTRFDVDPFGRVWYPDLGRYRVGVLDTNGNLITTFGGYGNAESCGPDSPVVDPQTKKLRPRKADDPKDLKSPFAEPEIALSWLIGVGATDKYAYMGDSMNRRLLRAKLVYAAEESCEVK
jgi:hypothetical protein